MDYNATLDFLYTQLPMFQRVGAPAYKPGLDTSEALAAAFGNPQNNYPTVHIGGTNGKGSTAHTLAAILQEAGYKTGLYTSPHLVDFRERIRVNGKMIPKDDVVDFVRRFRYKNLSIAPSFFELTMVMAFDFFAKEHVDVAVIEVGLGGRLDSTNIITPALSVITNISRDYMQFLGNTLPEIASEKAGIIKHGVPVVIGESEGAVRRVFAEKAAEMSSPIVYADDNMAFSSATLSPDGILYSGTLYGNITGQLTGECQLKNTATILAAVSELKKTGMHITPEAIKRGFAGVCETTGLAGRWMKLYEKPFTVCDTGHNEGGWSYLSSQLAKTPGEKHMVIGFVNDKDVSHILDMMPHNALYYFTQASVSRALPAEELARLAQAAGLHGKTYDSVEGAYKAALKHATSDDTIFIGGSTFVVADFLTYMQ